MVDPEEPRNVASSYRDNEHVTVTLVEGRPPFINSAMERFSFLSFTTLTVRPDAIDPARYGHHRSTLAPSPEGLRAWAFKEETGRDLFEAEHAEHVRRLP